MTEPTAAAPPTFKQIGEALALVEDPEIHVSVADLGLVYGASIEPGREGDGSKVRVRMSLTSPACPYAPMLLGMVHGAVARLPGVRSVNVDLTFDPLWDPRAMASDEAKDRLGIF